MTEPTWRRPAMIMSYRRCLLMDWWRFPEDLRPIGLGTPWWRFVVAEALAQKHAETNAPPRDVMRRRRRRSPTKTRSHDVRAETRECGAFLLKP